jgi:hypothetical protein
VEFAEQRRRYPLAVRQLCSADSDSALAKSCLATHMATSMVRVTGFSTEYRLNVMEVDMNRFRLAAVVLLVVWAIPATALKIYLHADS